MILTIGFELVLNKNEFKFVVCFCKINFDA